MGSLLRAIWFVVTLPLRLVFWLIWQVRRGAIAVIGASQRRFGQRTALLAFAAIVGLFGLGLIVGVVDCKPTGRGCIDGWEIPLGILFAAFAGYLAYVAVRKVPNLKESNVGPEFDYLRYDSKDWELSWWSVGLVAAIIGLSVLAVWIVASTR